MPSQHRKEELISYIPRIMLDLVDPLVRNAVTGPESQAQEILNRIESVPNLTPDDYKYLVDTVTTLIYQSKGKEVQIAYKGKVLTKETLFREFGVILPSKRSK